MTGFSFGVADLDVGRRILEATLRTVGKLKRVDYGKFNSLQKLEQGSKVENRYDRLMHRVGKIVCLDPQTERLFKEEKGAYVKIMTYIILFSADFADLDSTRRAEVENAQHMLINLLRRRVFTDWNRENAVRIFAGLLSCIADLREISHIKKSRPLNRSSESVPATATPPPPSLPAPPPRSSPPTPKMEALNLSPKKE